MTQTFDDEGNPLDYIYQNTWQSDYFVEFVRQLGWNVELIPDAFDSMALQQEHETVKAGRGTRIVDGRQADGNIVFDWTWARITPA